MRPSRRVRRGRRTCRMARWASRAASPATSRAGASASGARESTNSAERRFAMCGIVGYVGRERQAMDVLIDGLRRLEYRGYDSAGIAIFDQGEIVVRRALGKLADRKSTRP